MPRKKNTTGCLATVLAILFIAAILAMFWRPDPSSDKSSVPASDLHLATYVVSGTASTAGLTYTNDSGGTEQNDVSLPWKLEMHVPRRRFLYISAQNKSQYGGVKVELYVDGGLVQSASSEASYGIASAKGRVE